MIRLREIWATRKQRRAIENGILASADQAERQAWVDRDRGPDTEPWTPETLDRLWRMLRDDESA
jgi:hypothetical protein